MNCIKKENLYCVIVDRQPAVTAVDAPTNNIIINPMNFL